MQYRDFGKTGVRVSALGFGCMRLPTLATRDEIDEPQATEMLHHAIDQGLSYLDSGYGYHGGNSERFLGRALQGGYRQRVTLATKLPIWAVSIADDFDRLLNEQLARLQTERLDFYLLHGVNLKRWAVVRDLGVLPWLRSAQASGRIGGVGFSFHDTYEAFVEIVNSFDWDMCQIQYNYMNEQDQAGTRGLEYAASKGMGVVVMEPLLGGRLVNPPAAVQAVWDAAPVRRSPAEWALQWLWNKPQVSVVLSGMSLMRQVQENLSSAERSRVGQMTQAELDTVAQARDRYRSLCPAPCTACRYCMPCPNGVDIPGNFATLNNGVMYDQMDEARRGYQRRPEGERASACIQCRACEPKCPQSIVISEWMPLMHAILGEGQAYDPRACPKP